MPGTTPLFHVLRFPTWIFRVWTDDTSMALCLAESLIEKGRLDLCDQLRRYIDWYENGHLGSTGVCFDIGMTTRNALMKFRRDQVNPIVGAQAEKAAGNGSLMRLCAAPLAFWKQPRAAMEAAVWSSKTTHGAPQCLDACRYFAGLLVGCMNGVSKEELLSSMYSPFGVGFWDTLDQPLHKEIREVMEGSFRVREPPEIVGAGYVVKTLEAALWAFHHTDNFRDGCLKVANLGHDADTTAAVYGQIAGAYYGEDGIPQGWREKCCLAPLICMMSDELDEMSQHYATASLEGMAETGNVGSMDDASSTPQYTAGQDYWNLKIMGFDKMEEDLALFVRRMQPSPKAFKSLEEALEGKKTFMDSYESLDKEYCSVAIRDSMVQIMDGWISKESNRLQASRRL
ncbi:ADP-ribosylarginine hydrolase Tri1-like isoform X2 [Sycon ciliatum]|uniref:ADP-ribosylarginine hydrolase Tri1-like isoform X2 n=1 Tax=Sycon ciliatum TaxID=27933 RepID=UPI0031F68338